MSFRVTPGVWILCFDDGHQRLDGGKIRVLQFTEQPGVVEANPRRVAERLKHIQIGGRVLLVR